MFTVFGEVTLKRIDARTGESLGSIVKNNTFTKYGMARAIALNNIGTPFAKEYSINGIVRTWVVISSQTTAPDKNAPLISGIITDCIVPEGVPNRNTWVEATETTAAYGQTRVRLEYTGTPRTFRTVAVIDRPTNWNGRAGLSGQTSANAYAYVRFDDDIQQGAFEFIDIYYRCYFVNNQGFGLPNGGDLTRAIGRTMFGLRVGNLFASGNNSPIYSSISSISNPEDYTFLPINQTAEIANLFDAGVARDVDTSNTYNGNLRWRVGGATTSLSAITGRLINSLIVGDVTERDCAILTRKVVSELRTPIQTSWAKRANGTPFFSANDIAFGKGRVSAAGTWTGYYPEMYKIEITQSGNISTATYKFYRQTFTNYYGNSWRQISSQCPHLGGRRAEKFLPGSYGTNQKLKLVRFNDRKVIFWDSLGCTLVDVLDSSQFQSWGANTTSLFPQAQLEVEDVTQVYSNGTHIYVACRTTGLWKIDPNGTLNSVINVIPVPCYGVTGAAFSGVKDVYAVTDDGITFEASSWNTYFTPTHSLITSYGFAGFNCIEGNEALTSTNGEIALIFKTGTNVQIVWWSRTIGNGAAVSGYAYDGASRTTSSQYFDGEAGNLQCAPSGTWWAFTYYPVTFTAGSTRSSISYGSINFGSASPTVKATKKKSSNYHDYTYICFDDQDRAIYGSGGQWVGGDNPYIGSLLYFTNTTDGAPFHNTGSIHATSGNLMDSKLIYLKDNLILYGGSIVNINYNEWESWGWNGSSWELNHAGSKTVHTTQQALLNGITIAFDDKSETNPFFATDFYTLPIANGVLGDNARYVTYYLDLIGSGLRWKTQLPTGASQLQIPNIAPYQITVPGKNEAGFLQLEVTDSNAFQIAIDGVVVPHSNLVLNSVPPSAGFIGIDPDDGILTFHADDANKYISGFYSYTVSE